MALRSPEKGSYIAMGAFRVTQSIFVLGLMLIFVVTGVGAAGFTPTWACTTASNYYFDSASLSCQQCETTSQAATTDTCQCKEGYIYDYDGGTSASAANPPCSSCIAQGKSATADRKFCVSCGSTSSGLDTSTGICGCASATAILTEVKGSTFADESPCSDATSCTLECLECNTGAVLNTETGLCEACPDPRMTATAGQCVCTSGYTQLSNACLHPATATEVTNLYPATTAYTVSYPDVVAAVSSFTTSLTSKTLQDNFYAAAVNCKRGVEPRWCQFLANLCVLQMYDESASACGYFVRVSQATSGGSNTHGFSGWFATIGFLYFENNQIVVDSTIQSKMAFETTSGYVNSLNFNLVKYALNGTYLGEEDFTSQLQLCGGHYDTMTRWLDFGVFYQNKCNVRLESILNASETVFYDPYFIDSDGTYYPIPVMVSNLLKSGVKVNEKTDTYQHSYTRRFFAYDTVSGIVSGTSPDVIRLIDSATLEFTMQNDDVTKIYPPILKITYAEVDVTNLPAGSSASQSSSFKTTYEYDVSDFRTSMIEFLIAMIIIGTFTFIIRLYRWSRYNHNSDLNMPFMINVVTQFCNAAGTIVGIGIIFYSWYWYAFYKWQGMITIIPPKNDQLYDYYTALGFAMTCQFITIGYLILWQCRVTIFFIDWESSQGRRAGHDGTTAKCPVSTWRQLFIANEFNRLQTDRLISFEFTCIWVAALMLGFELQYAACLNPNGNDLYACAADNVHGILRFSVSSFIWVVVIVAQVLFVKLFKQNYVKHPSAQLVDLMCLTNISAFILTDKYYGYYIHGQSNLQHADTDIETVAGILKSEEKNIVSHRGLLPDDDTQTFCMYITQEVRDKFDDFLVLSDKEEADLYNQRGASGMLLDEFNNRGHSSVKKHADPLYTQMRGTNTSLKGFVKKMQTTYRAQIKELRWHDKWFHVPPTQDQVDYALFQKDTAASWVQIFYEGIEHELLLFDVMLFGFWQISVLNTMHALLLTYLTQKCLDYIRHELGVRNLSKTTLVGDRFFL